MPEYFCKCCNFCVDNKWKFRRHLKTQKHIDAFKICKVVNYQYEDQDNEVIVHKGLTYDDSDSDASTDCDTINYNNLSLKSSTDDEPIKCKYCGTTFRTNKGMIRHIKYYCLNNNNESFIELANLLNKKDQQIEESKKEISENKKEIQRLQRLIEKLSNRLQIKNIHNGNNINNTLNLNLLNYNKTVYDHLTEKDYIRCIQDCNHCVKTLIEKVHFNKSCPENMNIYISSIKGKFIMVYRDNKWQVKNRREQIDDLYECNEMLLENWYNEYCEKYPHIIQSFKRYLRNKDEDDELISRVKDEILMMLYNKRDLVLENKRIMEETSTTYTSSELI
jgi:uncharacterized C2H2 Zn-finger protein